MKILGNLTIGILYINPNRVISNITRKILTRVFLGCGNAKTYIVNVFSRKRSLHL